MKGGALAEQGQVEEGIAQICQGLTAWQAAGAELSRLRLLPRIAVAYGKAGQVEQGLSILAEALEMMDKTEEHWNEAELYRLKGELTLQSKVQGSKSKVEEEAEGYFLKAIAIARKQQAKSLGLRATMSLVRLRQQQALEQGGRSKESGVRSQEQEARTKLDEAHRMLSEVYNWFTEGFDTLDLKEAKALLESLESGV